MKKFLIVRMSAIGDVVFASPLIRAIKDKYPDAKIYWLAEPAVKDLLRCNDSIEKVVEFPKQYFKKLIQERKFLILLKELKDFIYNLRSYRIDIAIDAQGLLKSAFVAWLSGAKRRFGFKSKEFGHIFLTDSTDKGGDISRISSEYYHLIDFIGLEKNVPLNLTLCYDAYDKAEEFILSYHLEQGFIAIAPFTTRAQKHWFEEYWNDLIKKLKQDFNLPVVVLGASIDIEAANRIIKNSDAVSLAGKTNIAEAAAIVNKAKVTIGVDTGLTHISIAQMRPTIALFGSTVPYLKTNNPKAIVLYHHLECSPCHRHPTCDGLFECMRAIKPEEVIENAKNILLKQ